VSNHKGHIIGGCVAFGVTLSLVSITAFALHNYHSFLNGHHAALLTYFPIVLADIEYTIHTYFPVFIYGLTFLISRCWPIILCILEWFLCALIGAMFPDVDIKSTSQKYVYSILFVALIVSVGKKQLHQVAFLGALSILPAFFNHRGLFHRLWFVVLFPLLVWCWLSYAFPASKMILFYDMLFFIAGAISHLWLDMKTKMFKVRF
jgi:hypothetical protein